MTIDEVIQVVQRSDYVDARAVVAALLSDPSLLTAAKRVLSDMYVGADDAQKRFIVDGILEHLFESPEVKTAFSEWQLVPQLSQAFDEADEWATSVTKKRRFLSDVAHHCAKEMQARGVAGVTVEGAETGVDSVAIKWGTPDDEKRLILDCDDELVDQYSSDDVGRIRLATYAAEEKNWTPDEYAPWQNWVHLTA